MKNRCEKYSTVEQISIAAHSPKCLIRPGGCHSITIDFSSDIHFNDLKIKCKQNYIPYIPFSKSGT